MLFIDDDILFKPEDINRIYRDLKDGNDLVAGAYPVKDGTELACCGYGEETPFDGRLVACTYLATGFMGISARLLEKMVSELKMSRWNPNDNQPVSIPLLHRTGWSESYPFFEDLGRIGSPYGDIWMSEDYDFCDKAARVGIKPMLDTGIQLAHIGQRIYRFQDVVDNHAKKRAELAAKAGANAQPK